MECATSWLIRMGFERLLSSVLVEEFGSLGTNTDCDSYWGTPLGVANCGRNIFIPACGLLGGGLFSERHVDTRGSKVDQCNHQRV